MKKRKKRGPARLLAALLGLICALVLGALFYGAMVYQLAGEQGAEETAAAATPAPLAQGADVQTLFPGKLLSLDGELVAERAQDALFGGKVCRVITREYTLSDGTTVTVISATPAAYMERLAQEGWTPQLITGFTLAGLDAICELRQGQSMLIARDGAFVYALEAEANEQQLYALGAAAILE